MPTIWREGPYRVYFHSHEPGEPPHVHVDRENFSAKFWLQPVKPAANHGFAARELRVIERMLEEHREQLIRAWNDYFNT